MFTGWFYNISLESSVDAFKYTLPIVGNGFKCIPQYMHQLLNNILDNNQIIRYSGSYQCCIFPKISRSMYITHL